MKSNKSELNSYWIKNLDLPVEFVQMEAEQSPPSFSIDVETAKNMVSGTCILPSGSRGFIICKEEEKIKVFKITRKKYRKKTILIAQPEEWENLSREK